jgi:hypothetical protein
MSGPSAARCPPDVEMLDVGSLEAVELGIVANTERLGDGDLGGDTLDVHVPI